MGMEMESYSSNTGAMDKKEKLSTTRRKGGLVTMPFIIGNSFNQETYSLFSDTITPQILTFELNQ